MALQSQTTNPIAEFGALVRRQLWSILLPFAFVSALGVMVAQLMPRRYEVQTVVKIPEIGMPGTGGEIQRDVSSAVTDMRAEPLVRSVIESQEWSDYVGLTEKEKLDYVRRVIKNTIPAVKSVSKNTGGSNYITVKYSDSEGSRAERFLNNLRDRYIESVVAGVRAEARARRDTYKDLRQQYFEVYKQAEKAKADLVKERNLSALASPASGQARGEDPIYARLVQSQIQLVEAEDQLKQEQAKLEFTTALKAAEPESIPESAAAAIANAAAKVDPANEREKQVRDLEVSILELREKLKDYRPAASSYKRIEDEIARAESKIALLRGESTVDATKAGPTRFVPNPKLATYEQLINDGKTRIEGLKVSISSLKSAINDLTRDHQQRQDWYLQLSYLDQEVDRANSSFLQADAAYVAQDTRVALLQGPLANPFEIVEVAKASEVPNAPNVPLFVLISALLGLAAGLGWALSSEFLRNGFRGIPDLTRGLATPVLGAVNLITTRAQARRTWTRHVMITASSAVIVSAILWITWAYQHDSLRLLGPRFTQLIDEVRLAFRP